MFDLKRVLMLSLGVIRKKLMNSNLAEVSRETGLHVQGLYKIRDAVGDIKHSTVLILSTHFEGKDKCENSTE